MVSLQCLHQCAFEFDAFIARFKTPPSRLVFLTGFPPLPLPLPLKALATCGFFWFLEFILLEALNAAVPGAGPSLLGDR